MPVASLPPLLRSGRRSMQETAEDLLARYAVLKQARALWEWDWQDIVRYLAPGHDDVVEQHEPGQSRTEHIFDSHPLRAPKILADNIQGTVTNQSMQWRQLKFRDEEVNQVQAVGGWLQACDTRIMAAYSASNFYQASHAYYHNLGSFGTAAMFAGVRQQGDGAYLSFRTLPTGSYVVQESADGLVDTIFRDLWLTPRQAVQMFEGQVSEKMRELSRSKKDMDTYKLFLHCVYPRTDRNSARYDNRHMPFASVYLETEGKHICDESGYQEFPYLVSRWETLSRAPYGYGPGHLALPDVRMLNAMRDMQLQSLALMIRPPLTVIEEAVVGAISLESYALNVIRQQGALDTLKLEGRPDLVQIDQADLRRSIDDTFFVNALQALPPPDASNMTAYEVAQRIELMTRQMGPVFYRLLAEFLQPLEDRVFGIAWRAGALPQPPREVLEAAMRSNGQLDVDYDGPLARAQRGDDVKAIEGMVGLGGRLVEVTQSTEVLDNLDWDRAFRHAAEVQGIPRAHIRDMREVVRMRQLRAQQAQALQQAQMQNENMAAMGRVAPLVREMHNAPDLMAA